MTILKKLQKEYFPYSELSPKAKQKALAEFRDWYDGGHFDNEKDEAWQTERFAVKVFTDYGWFFYENGERA